MNKVFLTGMIANAPTLRMETGEVPHLIFSLSVRHKTRSGELRNEYYRISAWNNSARWGSVHLTRGQVVCVQGYLSQRKIQKEQETLFIPEVVAEEFLPMRQVQMAVIASDEADDGACTDSAAV